MRIIAGRAKGRPLTCVAGQSVRPTPERMRLALFNILGDQLTDAHILDLFAGTGSLGLEALSRGAAHAVFVEMSTDALGALRHNIQALGFTGQTTVLARDVFRVAPHLAKIQRSYDVMFVAPPYALLEHRTSAERLFHLLGELAGPFGRDRVSLNLQHSPQSHVPDRAGDFRRIDHRCYGYAELSRFERSAAFSAQRSDPATNLHAPLQVSRL
ncbi:MAG: 16S rRNA (guanine(966)-N(2))-methyltransferase RsmD [Planctomycetes bacterium]|nr:16S rRNA (guanine(966)-N(2))-methyltransferase RsmD [Planctomycetota bacterium]